MCIRVQLVKPVRMIGLYIGFIVQVVCTASTSKLSRPINT